jgi:Ca-activated chloride channel family protein
MMKPVIIWTALLLSSVVAMAQTTDVKKAAAAQEEIYKGNQLYKNKDYKGASAAYDKALAHEPGSTKGAYNSGNAQYQIGDFEKAQEKYAAAAKSTKDKQEKARAYHNLGNAHMKKEQWKEAVDAYKESLKLNPNDNETRYNLAYALEKLKNQNKDNTDKNNKDDKDKKDQDKNQQNKNNDNGEQKPEQQQPQSAPSKLSQKEAENLLNALRAEEKRIQDKKNEQKGIPIKVKKDW